MVSNSNILGRGSGLLLALAMLAPAAAGASERGVDARVGVSRIGPHDQLGRLSMMTPATRSAILARIEGGQVYDLAQNYFPGMPSFTEAGDPPFQLWMTHTPDGAAHDNPFGTNDVANRVVAYSGDAISMYTHVGTHIDTLNHFGLHGRVWNGFEASRHLGDRGWDVNGADKIPPIVARGVLLDIPALKGTETLPAGYRITPEDIRAFLAKVNVSLGQGDVVLVRTGKCADFKSSEAYKRAPAALDLQAAVFLAEQGAMIVGVDVINPEPLPSGLSDNYLPVHTYLLAEQGVLIIENLDLEALARDRIYEFAFVAAPLKIEGASGAPIRPVALPVKRRR
jgi:kynurenine formamidase